jgi:hypothetical protein
MRQAYYRASLEEFLEANSDEVIGKLNLGATAYVSQWTIGITSWESSIDIYKRITRQLADLSPQAKKWTIFLEYEIPRLAGRIDAVIIAEDIIFVVEFKFERKKFESADIRQVEDYALDLADFHLASRDKIIVPILLAPLAPSFQQSILLSSNSKVQVCLKANAIDAAQIIHNAYVFYHDDTNEIINTDAWEGSLYQPTPTIIQAAKALFAGQEVEAITKSGADKDQLFETSKFLVDAIRQAKADDEKIVCFITGVPGAGKTLIGLNIVHEKDEFEGDEFNTAYFFGNGPLINVLREALARDHFERHNTLYKNQQVAVRPTRRDSHGKIKSKVQNLHQFIKDGIRKAGPPDERIVVFDEAQRCWDATHFYNKSKQNENREKTPFEIQKKSEADLLFEFMSRHNGWAVIIALVGGGQEINTGEAGIAEWGKVIKETYSNWKVYISPELLSGDSATANQTLFKGVPKNVSVHQNHNLHLQVSERSFRTKHLNSWVNAVINNSPDEAINYAALLKDDYPIALTRDLNVAKQWLRNKVVGNKRVGLVASSGALRLRPYGIFVREEVDEALWFLNDPEDVRSSNHLEIVATEYKVQGLELDFTGVCWDADLRRENDRWNFKSFSGTRWQQSTIPIDHQFILNTYRVLLTRAREGMIIFVPKGDVQDETRLPKYYDPIFDYLKSCGLSEV